MSTTSTTPAPCSFRLPRGLRDRIRARAAAELRSFSAECRYLIEAGLASSGDPSSAAVGIDEAEVERLAALYHETIAGKGRG